MKKLIFASVALAGLGLSAAPASACFLGFGCGGNHHSNDKFGLSASINVPGYGADTVTGNVQITNGPGGKAAAAGAAQIVGGFAWANGTGNAILGGKTETGIAGLHSLGNANFLNNSVNLQGGATASLSSAGGVGLNGAGYASFGTGGAASAIGGAAILNK